MSRITAGRTGDTTPAVVIYGPCVARNIQNNGFNGPRAANDATHAFIHAVRFRYGSAVNGAATQ